MRIDTVEQYMINIQTICTDTCRQTKKLKEIKSPASI